MFVLSNFIYTTVLFYKSDKLANLYQVFKVDSLEGLMLHDGNAMISLKTWFSRIQMPGYILTLLIVVANTVESSIAS